MPGSVSYTGDRPIIVPSLPQSLYVEVTSKCNSLCVHCPRTFYGRHWKTDLGLAEFEAILAQLPELKRIVLHGLGEPLLNPELFTMIRLLKARDVHVVFNSNAIALLPPIQRELIDCGLDEYRVSFDAATPETYRKIRGVPAFPRVVVNVRSLMRLKQQLGAATPRVSIWFVTMKDNLHELPELVRLAAGLGVDEVYVQRLVFFDEGLAIEAQSLYGRLSEQEQRLLDEAGELGRRLGVCLNASGRSTLQQSLGAGTSPGQDGRPWMACRRPWELSYITAEGEVLPCCFVPFVTNAQWQDYVLGDVRTQSLAEIWNGERYREFRRRFLSDAPPECCRGCGVKWSV